MLIQNGRVHDAIHEAPYQADILIRDGKIAAIGRAWPPETKKLWTPPGWTFIPGLWTPTAIWAWTATA